MSWGWKNKVGKYSMKKIMYILIFILLLFVYANSQEMPHEKLKHACKDCHETAEWDKIHFDHSQTGFFLDGRHHGVACIHCHNLKDFDDVKNTCNACHIDVHQSKLPYACETCHTSKSWRVLDIFQAHANTSFRTFGVHARLNCDACHQTEILGQYSGLKSYCFSCHFRDYEGTQNPNHQEFGFRITCEDCHTMAAWSPAAFVDHDARFPITSGAHAGVWEICQDCHTDRNNFRIFSCINCHAHNRAATTSRHDEVRGFVYESNACYRCHPRGQGEGD
jgi:hypothetical protein